MVCFGSSALAQPASESESQADQIAALNAELSAAPSGSANPGQARQLLNRRAALLADLIASDPAKALTLALPQEVAGRLGADPYSGAIEVHGEWAGAAEAIVEDGRHGRSGRTLWYLHTSQGPLELYFAGQSPSQPHAAVSVRGMRSANRVAVAEIATQSAASAPPCLTTGVQKIAVLMLTMPSARAFPTGFDPSYFNRLFFGPSTGSITTDSVNSFWQEASYGKTSATGQVFGPFALAQDYDPSHLWDMQAAAIKAADSAADFTQFTRVVLLFPVQDSGLTGWHGAVSGLSTIGCGTIPSPSKGSLTESTVWLPVYPFDQPWAYLGLAAHELGHSLGLNHESSEGYGDVPLGAPSAAGTLTEYGSPYSVMGMDFDEFNGTQLVLGQYSSEHKSILNWLLPGDYQEVSSSGAFSLAPYESLSGLRALRVARDPASNSWLWVEYRQPVGDIDRSLAFLPGGSNVFDGAVIHYENPNLDALHMYLLDFNPLSPGSSFFEAALGAGQTWQDPFSLLSLTVNQPVAGRLNVTVGRNPSCATFRLSAPAFPATGGTGTIAVTSGPTCSWTAATYAPWITFSGSASGKGNGTVSFAVSQNNGLADRSGNIWVDRQSQAVSQPASAVPLLMAPANGATGIPATPRLGWSTLNGAASYDVYLGTSPSPPRVANTSADNYVPAPLSANTLYYWRIVAQNAAMATSTTGSFRTESPGPAVPTLLSPPNGSADIPLMPMLLWSATTGVTSYDVYFGAGSAAPPLVTTTAGTSYAPGPLLSGQNYYWRVVARNSSGSNGSATWSFSSHSTVSSPDLLTPADGATGVSLTPALSWSAATGAASYWVHCGTSWPPALLYDTRATSYSPGPLQAGSLYYWYVVSTGPAGQVTSVLRTFTTGAGTAPPTTVLTAPASGATGVSLMPSLSWNAAAGATSYDVYFGASSPPPLAATTIATSYAPPTLPAGKLYYWRVVAKNSAGSAASATWSFTTLIARPPAPVLTAPASGATGVSLTPSLSWSTANGATSYEVHFGTSSPPPLAATVTGTSYAPARIAPGTTCYWQIVARNTAGTAASAIWTFRP